MVLYYPAQSLLSNYNYFTNFEHHSINACLKASQFPPDLKSADVTPVH